MKQLLNEQKTQDKNRHKGTRQKLLSGFFCKGTVWHQELKNGQFGTGQFDTIYGLVEILTMKFDQDLCLNCDKT